MALCHAAMATVFISLYLLNMKIYVYLVVLNCHEKVCNAIVCRQNTCQLFEVIWDHANFCNQHLCMDKPNLAPSRDLSDSEFQELEAR